MKYRDHKGSLADSMATEIEVNTKQDLINHLNSLYIRFGKEVMEVKFTYVGHNRRINDKVYYVFLRFEGENDFKLVGMSNDEF